jgi:hypothetical protein
MGWSKRQFISQAMEEIGLASYVFDLQPEQLESALRRLDAMMAEWNGRGLRLGYPIPGSPQDSNLDEASGVPDNANEAIYLNLALRLAPSYGKQVSSQTMSAASRALSTVSLRLTTPPKMQLPGSMPAGAGNKPWRNNGSPFLDRPSVPLDAGDDGEITFD